MATQVILLERVRNLGNLGDEVAVKPGYARNFLIPQGKAVSATEANRARFEARRVELEARANEQLAAAQGRAAAIGELAVTISARASDEGRLYGSVGTREIAEAATAACGHEIDKAEVLLPEGPIRAVGEYAIEVMLHTDVKVTISVAVIPE